ncbi:MAG: hypothetical protein K0U74_05435 [Alphaproteobacteria bacterium]|nr:hypothetical protein [Alphaproteobacteria bacterium]
MTRLMGTAPPAREVAAGQLSAESTNFRAVAMLRSTFCIKASIDACSGLNGPFLFHWSLEV